MKKLLLFLSCIGFLFSCNQRTSNLKLGYYNNQGIDALNKGELDEAILSFNKALNQPNLPIEFKAQVLRNIAQTFIEKGQPDSAIHFSQLAANCYDKNSYEYLSNIADIEILKGKIPAAIIKLRKAVKMKPDNVAANNTLGLIYLGEYGMEYADPDEALKYNRKAFEINQDRITEEVLAKTYFLTGEYDSAVFHFEKLSNEFPGLLHLKLNLGIVKFEQDKGEEADSIFAALIKADSSMAGQIKAYIEGNE